MASTMGRVPSLIDQLPDDGLCALLRGILVGMYSHGIADIPCHDFGLLGESEFNQKVFDACKPYSELAQTYPR